MLASSGLPRSHEAALSQQFGDDEEVRVGDLVCVDNGLNYCFVFPRDLQPPDNLVYEESVRIARAPFSGADVKVLRVHALLPDRLNLRGDGGSCDFHMHRDVLIRLDHEAGQAAALAMEQADTLLQAAQPNPSYPTPAIPPLRRQPGDTRRRTWWLTRWAVAPPRQGRGWLQRRRTRRTPPRHTSKTPPRHSRRTSETPQDTAEMQPRRTLVVLHASSDEQEAPTTQHSEQTSDPTEMDTGEGDQKEARPPRLSRDAAETHSRDT